MIARSAKPIPKRRSKPRRGDIVNPNYLKFIHTQPCLLLEKHPDIHQCNGPLQAHHVNVAASGLDDTRTVPLCFGAHQHDGSSVSVHRLGRLGFERFHGLLFAAEIERLQEMYLAETGKQLERVGL